MAIGPNSQRFSSNNNYLIPKSFSKPFPTSQDAGTGQVFTKPAPSHNALASQPNHFFRKSVDNSASSSAFTEADKLKQLLWLRQRESGSTVSNPTPGSQYTVMPVPAPGGVVEHPVYPINDVHPGYFSNLPQYTVNV